MERRKYQVQSLLIILVVNGLMLAVLFSLFPTLGESPAILAGVGGIATLLLWTVLDRFLVARIAQASPIDSVSPSRKEELPTPEPIAPAPPPPPPGPGPEVGALQILAILQRKGRLIDFLREDIGDYQDAQIGAAVRTIHAGCREALDEHVNLEPVMEATEGSQVSIEPGFDPSEVRLSGAVHGEPPFRGTLRHRGWKARAFRLPEIVEGAAERQVVAPAEVEVSS